MEIEAGDWVLIDGKHEAYVIRGNHYGDSRTALISNPLMPKFSLTYVHKNRLTKLDPALYPFLESEYERIKRRRI